MGLLVISAAIITITTLPCLVLRRRLTRTEDALSRAINAASTSQRERVANIAHEQSKMSKKLDLLLLQTDRVAGDIKDIRNIMLKERGCVTALESHLGVISEQLNTQEQKILAGLATGQGRVGRTETDINELRKMADKNTCKLNKVGDSLADIAAFIDMTEIERGVLPERGQESSRRVNALRLSALKLQDGNTTRK
ncbi:hypothetical protein M0805_007475 [Coniferiporia weirii]|nr:hypothetical protein M0805_007475 [Coniferiporia weirii]